MNKDEILHLGMLSRISLTDAEVEEFQGEINSIIEYVSDVTTIAGSAPEKMLTPRYNVFREDEVTNDPGALTEGILKQAPKRHEDYIEVKKIISTDT